MDRDTAAEYEGLLEEFALLEEQLPKARKTIMGVSGYPHYENVVSNLLAFFLDSREEHGFGDLWPRSLLECALGADTASSEETGDVDREACTPAGKRLDILFSTQTYTVGIENKVFAGLYNDLGEYAKLIESRAREAETQPVGIVLSLHDLSSQQSIEGNGFVNVTYAKLFAAVRSHLGEYLDSADNTWVAYMKDFIYTVEKQGSGNSMTSAADQFIRDHYLEADKLYMHLYKWKKDAKGRARAILESAELPTDIDYCQDSFVYQDADGFYTSICIDIKPPETHRLAESKGNSHLTIEVYRNEDGWGTWIWSRNNKEGGRAIIAELLDKVGIAHDKDNVVAKLPWDATDEQVIELVNEGIAVARQIL